MNNKIAFTICAVITSIIGLSGGFIITKSIAMQKEKTASVLNSIPIQKDLPIAEEIPKIDISEPTNSIIIEPQVKQKNTEVVKPKISTYTCPKPKKDYEDESYLDVGQKVGLEDKSYIPSDLVILDKNISKYSNLCIKEEVSIALDSMIADAKQENLYIIISSGFRDYDTQNSILSNNIKTGNKDATKLIAKPGHSEHQLGLAVDFTSPSIGNVSATGKFGDTAESKWLEENASKYGFIQSYPKDKEEITGYLYEPWHYRYVGIENATEIIKSGQTINEYLKEKKEFVMQNKTTL